MNCTCSCIAFIQMITWNVSNLRPFFFHSLSTDHISSPSQPFPSFRRDVSLTGWQHSAANPDSRLCVCVGSPCVYIPTSTFSPFFVLSGKCFANCMTTLWSMLLTWELAYRYFLYFILIFVYIFNWLFNVVHFPYICTKCVRFNRNFCSKFYVLINAPTCFDLNCWPNPGYMCSLYFYFFAIIYTYYLNYCHIIHIYIYTYIYTYVHITPNCWCFY
jgi:hypothetical protein